MKWKIYWVTVVYKIKNLFFSNKFLGKWNIPFLSFQNVIRFCLVLSVQFSSSSLIEGCPWGVHYLTLGACADWTHLYSQRMLSKRNRVGCWHVWELNVSDLLIRTWGDGSSAKSISQGSRLLSGGILKSQLCPSLGILRTNLVFLSLSCPTCEMGTLTPTP